MKIFILPIIGCLLSSFLWAQNIGRTNTKASVINYSNVAGSYMHNRTAGAGQAGKVESVVGNVGIGTTIPNARLTVKDDTSPMIAVFDGPSYMYVGFFENGLQRGYLGSYSGNSEDFDIGTSSNNNSGKLQLTTVATPRLTIDSIGRIGINKTNPTKRLEVNGDVKLDSLFITTGNAGDELYKSSANGRISTRKGVNALGLRYCIAIQGVFPTHSRTNGQDPYIGEIILFAGNFAPSGYMLCEGQPMSIIQNQALFAILGTTYGGNGNTTFMLPDLRNAVPVHAPAVSTTADWHLGESNK